MTDNEMLGRLLTVDFIDEHGNPLNALNTLQKVSELMEMGTRIGEFRRAIRAGASPLEAANAAKDISLNFARAGFKGKVWNQLRAFFNASVQDVDKLVRAHKANPGRTAAKAFAYITVPTIGAWYLARMTRRSSASRNGGRCSSGIST